MHTLVKGGVRKALRTAAGNTLIEIKADQDQITIQQLAGVQANDKEVGGFVQEWFDLDRDLRPFYDLLKKDKDLAPLATLYKGFKIVGIPNLYECMLWCIAGQQINLNFAYTLKRRLVEEYGDTIYYQNKAHFLFPEPAVLVSVPVESFRKMQFTTRKAEYIKGISEAFCTGAISKELLVSHSTESAQLQHLLAFRGIGEWSANYVLMKSVRAMNRIPVGDAGLNQALKKFKGIERNNNSEVIKTFEPFTGWKTYLVFYLWRNLRNMA